MGIKADTLRGWAKQAQSTGGCARDGNAAARMGRWSGSAELRRVKAILRTASAFFAAELDHR